MSAEMDESTIRLLQLLAMLGGNNLDDDDSSSGAGGSSQGSTPNTSTFHLDGNYVMVAAIDFGTTFSGYAFSFKNNITEITMNKNWGAEAGCASYKTPTCLLLDPQQRFQSFGYAAQKEYTEMVDDDSKKYYYFERFKMKLHDPKDLNERTTIKAANGKSVPALAVFSASLKYLRDHLVGAVSASMEGKASPDLIRWVITVPAIWGDAAKQFMREAALQAGLITEAESQKKLVIALEPEAASLYVRSLDINHFTGSSANNIQKGDLNIQTGTKYFVIDAGGGTLDITAHELQSNGKVKELYFATGGPYGGTKVDEEFVKLMGNVFGKAFLDNYQAKCASQWLIIMHDFEKKKRVAKKGDDKSTNIPLTWSFGTEYQNHSGKSVEVAVKKYSGGGVKFTNGMLSLSPDVMQNLFKPVVKGIVTHISELLEKDKLHDIDYFFCVGGFSESPILQDAIYDNFGNGATVLVPAEASLAVLKGAVHFGHEPNAISSRMSARTYGVETVSNFIPIMHRMDKARKIDGELYCGDIFRTFVKRGEVVKAGYSKSIEFSPVRANQDAADVEVYSSERTDAEYIDDDGVEHHGKINVKWPGRGTNRQLKITMTFGGTEVHVSAVSQPGGNSAETKINFFEQ